MIGARLILFAAVLAAACSDLSSPRTVSFSKPKPAMAVGQQRAYATLDLEYVAIATAESSFGGMYLDSTQTPVVFLTDTTRLAAARQAGVDASLSSRGKSTDHIRVVHGAYSFAQLKRWRDMGEDVLTVQGTTAYGIDKARNRLQVGISDSTARSRVETRLGQLGVPLEAVEIQVETVSLLSGELNASVQDSVRPLRGGIQVTRRVGSGDSVGVCTLGFIAKSGGHLYVVTNSHCSHTEGTVDTTTYFQNNMTYSGSDSVAKEVLDPAFQSGYFGALGEYCPTSKQCRVSDSNKDSILPQFSGTIVKGLIARTVSPAVGPYTTGALDIYQSYPGLFITSTLSGAPMVGDSLWKTGRSSGTTGGVVVTSCYDAPVDSYPDSILLCQDEVRAWAKNGDSGSPVYYWNRAAGDDTVRLAGIVWGKICLNDCDSDDEVHFTFSPMPLIEADLGTLDVNADSLHFFNDLSLFEIDGPSIVEATGTYTYTIDYSGGTGSATYSWQYQDAVSFPVK